MSYEKIKMVEVGGIEPPSEYNARPLSTCVVSLLVLATAAAERQATTTASLCI